jgi:hypothetical protein
MIMIVVCCGSDGGGGGGGDDSDGHVNGTSEKVKRNKDVRTTTTFK